MRNVRLDKLAQLGRSELALRCSVGLKVRDVDGLVTPVLHLSRHLRDGDTGPAASP